MQFRLVYLNVEAMAGFTWDLPVGLLSFVTCFQVYYT